MANKTFKLDDTTITTAGVLRCCLQSVGNEDQTKLFRIGDKLICRYCKEPFTLTKEKLKAVWIPDWML